MEYHTRWEVENTIDELKVHLVGRKTHVRSQKPREVVQEVYSCLLGHWAVRSLIFQGAANAGIAPLRLSFTGTEASYSACASQISTFETRRTAFFFSWLTLEILDTFLPERVHRINPRVVKKPVLKFRSKKVKHRGTGTSNHPPAFHIIRTAWS